MRKAALINPERFFIPALLLVLLVGIAFRIYALIVVGFDEPFDMGGLFYQMSLEIIRNHFILPVNIPYYYPGGLPFAYPPLAFYIQSTIIKLFSPPLFVTVNLLPSIFSILSIFTFYLLAKQVLQQRWRWLAALLFFAIIPLAVTELVEGMGLAESLGINAIILYTWSLVRVQGLPTVRNKVTAGFLLALCVVSSPGSLYAAILISLLYQAIALVSWISSKKAKDFISGLVIGLVGIMASSPYWVSVIGYHGIKIFLDAFKGQNISLFSQLIENFLEFRLIWSTPVWNALFILCLGLVLWRKHIPLFLYTLLLLLILRERWIASIPVSLVLGEGIGILLDILSRIRWKRIGLVKVSIIWVLVLILVYDAGAYLIFTVNEDTYDVSASQVDELQRINSENLIPENQSVVTLGSWGLIEWSPALLERTVLNNPYGLEWIPGQEAKMTALTQDLKAADSMAKVSTLLKDSFPGVSAVYLVLDEEVRNTNFLNGQENGYFKIIQYLDHLTLALLILQ